MAKASLALAGTVNPLGGLTFKYNPEKFSLSKTADWDNPGVSLTNGWKEPRYIKTTPGTLTMEIFFDAFEELAGDVSLDVSQLVDWTKPGPANRPPLLVFKWGDSRALLGMQFYLSSVSATYTLFRFDGTPIRATCNITLMEATNPSYRQNPTSGGRPGMESHVLVDGETLHSVAWARYGEARFWRAIAEVNGIDDPLRVASGTSLLIPPRRDAAGLS